MTIFTTASVKELLDDHMGDQPYAICCRECNAALDVVASVDSDNDLSIEVDPHTCKEDVST